MISRLYNFRGFVQNVGFRSFLRNIVTKYGITGWVQNNPDGTVSALMEGEKTNIENAVEKIVKGNGIIEVRNFIIEEEKYLQQRNFKSFFIKF
ncbi:MAG: acylphosphatase [Exilispira sp.]